MLLRSECVSTVAAALCVGGCSSFLGVEDWVASPGPGQGGGGGQGGASCVGCVALGDPCDDNAVCAGGICQQGACCDAACDACSSCNLPGRSGHCQAVPSAEPDPDGRCPAMSLCDGSGVCALGEPSWAILSLAPTPDGPAQALSIDRLSSGDVVVTGGARGSLAFNGSAPHALQSGYDIFVAKLDSGGKHLASTTFGGMDDEIAFGIAAAGMELVLAGQCGGASVLFGTVTLGCTGGRSDAVVAGLAPLTLEPSWAYADATAGIDAAYDVAARGVKVVLGGQRGSADMMSLDGFVGTGAGMNGSGPIVLFEGPGNQLVRGVAVASTGDIAVAGSFETALHVGTQDFLSKGPTDGFVALLSPQGDPMWVTPFGTAGVDAGFAVAVGPNGDVAVAGIVGGSGAFGVEPSVFGGDRDACVAVFAPDARLRWTRCWGSAGYDAATAVGYDAAGNVIVGGWFDGEIEVEGTQLASAGGRDMFLVKLSPVGDLVWARGFGSPGVDVVWDLVTDPTGGVLACGESPGGFTLGNALPQGASNAALVFRVSP